MIENLAIERGLKCATKGGIYKCLYKYKQNLTLNNNSRQRIANQIENLTKRPIEKNSQCLEFVIFFLENFFQ